MQTGAKMPDLRNLPPAGRLRIQNESAYRTAVGWSEAACRIAPSSGACLNTLGVGQYRVGRYRDALVTLTRSNALNGGLDPWDLAFLAMAQHQSGRKEEALRTLSQFRAAMKVPTPGSTADPFAP